MPDWHPVQNSSNVSSAAYDADKHELWIRFEHGGVYIYSDVPEDILEGLLAADSPGQFVNQQIKGTYQFRKA